ncbi:plexin-A4-like [Asterias rubens]|uniref:plexin-A4-like n=1 Tax=Asterias rubens TaxID=7604 RepID=UPI0014555780|nr:plexin-A4-like [Asterias rubens]
MMSSITTTNELNHTVAFIGTSTGSLLKVHIEGGTSARHYESIDLGDAPVLRDIAVTDTKQQIYVLTEQQLLKLRVEHCNQHTSCETCIGMDGDPYCGWCTLENKCTRRLECKRADDSTNHWLPYNETQCVAISSVHPYTSLPFTEPQKSIVLTIKRLPELQDGETYSCKFNDLPVYQGTTTGNTVACSIPPPIARPNLPPNEDHVYMQLSVVSSVSMVAFISTEFTFYQCSRHKSCGECVTSSWDCDWCVFDNTCAHQSTDCSNEFSIVNGLNNPAGAANRGPTLCPQLQPQYGEVLVPVDIQQEIQVNVSNIPDSNELNYKCSLLIDNLQQSVKATRVSDDVIICNSRSYTYEADDVNEFVAQLSISWNNDRELDDFNKFNVTLYKCHVDRLDCSRCLSVDTARPELKCRWCGTQCANIENTVCSNSALAPGGQCPAPYLERVVPVSGPMEGNTVIKVIGTNIGQRFQDVRSVMVGQQPCDLTGLEDQYITGQSVSCLTAPMSQYSTHSVTISVAPVDGDASLQSTGKVDFTYTDPMIINFHPRIGPEAGGTLINIIGVNMDAGTDIKAMVDTNVPCAIVWRNNTAIVCSTAASTVGKTGRITVSFDGALRSSTDNFTFQPNPDVIDIQPRRSIKSGGRKLTVSGTGLSVSRATMFVQHDKGMDNMFEESCEAHNDSIVVCTSPAIKLPDTMTSSCTDVTVGFQLDGFEMLLETTEFSYCLDPTFDNNEDLEVSDKHSLQIKGKRLVLATDKSEVWVTVGDKNCTVTELGSIILFCTLPMERPGSKSAMVRWYGNLTFDIGEVTFPADGVTLTLVIISSVAIAFLLLSVILLAMYFRQRKDLKGRHERLLTRIRHFHEDILEMAAAKEQASPSTETPHNIKSSQQPVVLNNSVNIVPEDVQITFNQLDIGRLLGQGAFGKVFKAVLKDSPTGPHRTVTVKTASDVDDPGNVIKFLEEGLKMKTFDHPNVLGLIGLTFDLEGQPLIVLPFMGNGDLKCYLEKYKPEALTVLKFAQHVALGMEYLADRKFVHRDLAARNCLVDEKLVVKVGDFGLSRDLTEENYYTSNDKEAKLPIKWMALESMERRVYNTKTDVWSYGVLLWELFTGGLVPYPGIPNKEVYDYLKRGHRMDAPKFCHRKISDIMRSCWNESPRKRCSFQQIIKSLNEVMAIMTGNFSPLDLEEPGCAAANAGYLIPMKAMDGGFSIEEGKSMGKNAYANVTTRK